jgi:hypothetical protein
MGNRSAAACDHTAAAAPAAPARSSVVRMTGIAKEQREHVESLAGFGLLHREICLLIINPATGKPIGEKTLRAAFKGELAVGVVKTNGKVVQSLYKNALKGNVTAQIWWTKCRMGWKETVRTEVTGKVKLN